MKSGAPAGNYRVLSDEQLERIHLSALGLLWDPGILCESTPVLDLMRQAGATVDAHTRMVRLPAAMVEQAIRTAPSSFVLHGRADPAMDLSIEDGRVYYGMGGTSEPLTWDWKEWKPRRPTKADVVANTRVGHALPNIDFVQTLCMSGDQPTGQIFFHDFDAIFRNTTKPSVINILERPFTQHLLEITAAASGGESLLREKPSVLGIVTPITPLKFAVMNEGILDAVQAGVPIRYSPGPLMGATGPATVAGTVVLTMAEVRFGVVLTQAIRPGAPVILKPDVDVFDMSTTQCTYSSPEQNLGKAAAVQLARHYHLPIYGLGGGVEAKVPDAEAAAIAMMSMLMVGMAGMNMCQSLGTMSWGQYGAAEMAVICDEMVAMIRRVLSGIAFNDETLALDVIREVGPGGSFLQHDHTVAHFRKELFFPKFFRRQTLEQWQAAGSKMIHDVAHDRVEEILRAAGPVPLPPGADAEIERAVQRAITWSEQSHS
ncbi:MAG: trimethylamine methyltransferase family protein [Anaerolineales bacterium]|nr:trimethylamine methyltransferase family protein [Anaerolineales bacterium]